MRRRPGQEHQHKSQQRRLHPITIVVVIPEESTLQGSPSYRSISSQRTKPIEVTAPQVFQPTPRRTPQPGWYWVVASRLLLDTGHLIGHLQVPRDNAILAPVVLTVPPVVAAWICGYRRFDAILVISVSLSVLTLILTLVVSKRTGIADAIFNRALAGLLAGVCLTKGTRLAA